MERGLGPWNGYHRAARAACARESAPPFAACGDGSSEYKFLLHAMRPPEEPMDLTPHSDSGRVCGEDIRNVMRSWGKIPDSQQTEGKL